MKKLEVRTQGRTQFVDLTGQIQSVVSEFGLKESVVTVFVPHTTAGVTINEHADPDVMADLEQILDRIVPWAGPYAHGEGNSAAHAKASLMGSSARIMVSGGRLKLGTWQGIFLCEFDGPRDREVWIQ